MMSEGMLTRTLLIAIAVLVVGGTWRLARWYWRPRLVLPDALILERATDGVRVFLDVRNEGAGRSRGCRAILIRCERREAGGWIRVDPKRAPDRADPNGPKVGIHSRDSARIALDHVLPDEPGSYRLEIAVIDGEERRSSYVIEMQAVGPDASP
jgi:hypothetical protein